ncbi:hypothetical protein B0920_10660 [Massilia sp. KIM]|uniref:hypothetical protein n=1 Tax=Massilia sp. KIM TaxID=1955422 RepID=UPI00098FAA9A|nr:hypothetical protein [Massilia sp. KIM]OON63784.1 hypothetical protein B0920_10660 [Massilia sp. KIM]
MRRRIGQSLRIGLSAHGLALVRTSRLFGNAPLALAERHADLAAPGALADGLRALFADDLGGDLPVGGWPVSVVLADELVRLWQVPPPPGASRPADLEAAARLRFQHLFGSDGGDWRIQADWDAAHPFLAAAVPGPLLDQLIDTTRALRLHLVEVVPQFVAAMNEWRRERRPGAWFGLVQGGVLSLAAYDGKRLAAVRTAVIPAGADRDWLEAHVAREALRVGVGRPERLQLCGAAPARWASSVGRLKFACILFEHEDDAANAGWTDLARLARTGSAA